MVSDCELYSYSALGPLHKSHLTWSNVYCNTTTTTTVCAAPRAAFMRCARLPWHAPPIPSRRLATHTHHASGLRATTSRFLAAVTALPGSSAAYAIVGTFNHLRTPTAPSPPPALTASGLAAPVASVHGIATILPWQRQSARRPQSRGRSLPRSFDSLPAQLPAAPHAPYSRLDRLAPHAVPPSPPLLPYLPSALQQHSVRLGTPPSSLDDVTLEWNKPKEEDEGPEFESWRTKLVFQLNTNISRSDWRLCPIGQHLVNLIIDKQFDTCLWCLIVNSTAIRP